MLTLIMADPSLASTAVFGSATIKWSEINWRPSDAGRKLGEKLLSQKHEFKTLSSVPTLRQFGSAEYQLQDRLITRGFRIARPRHSTLGCPRSTSSYQER